MIDGLLLSWSSGTQSELAHSDDSLISNNINKSRELIWGYPLKNPDERVGSLEGDIVGVRVVGIFEGLIDGIFVEGVIVEGERVDGE